MIWTCDGGYRRVMDKCSESRSISLYIVKSLSLRRLRYMQYVIIICRVMLLLSIKLVVIVFYYISLSPMLMLSNS
jgi:hypothetical protein